MNQADLSGGGGSNMGAIEIVLTAYMSISGAAIGYLYRQLWNMRDDMETIAGEHLKDIQGTVNELRKTIEDDRRRAEESRVRLAEQMVTKGEFQWQIERLIGEIRQNSKKSTE